MVLQVGLCFLSLFQSFPQPEIVFGQFPDVVRYLVVDITVFTSVNSKYVAVFVLVGVQHFRNLRWTVVGNLLPWNVCPPS